MVQKRSFLYLLDLSIPPQNIQSPYDWDPQEGTLDFWKLISIESLKGAKSTSVLREGSFGGWDDVCMLRALGLVVELWVSKFRDLCSWLGIQPSYGWLSKLWSLFGVP